MPLTGAPAAVVSQVDQQRSEFIQTVEEVIPERDEVVKEFDRLVQTFNDHWGWMHRNVFNRGAYDEEKAQLERIREAIEETPFPEETGGGAILDLAERVFDHHTPVVSLFRTSMGWVEDTSTPTSDVYARIFTEADRRDIEDWEDKAREAYDGIVAQQQSSTEALVDVAKFMSSWLSSIADDNVGFVTTLLDYLAEIAGIIAAGITDLATSFGVFTLEKIGDAVGEAVENAIQLLGEIARRISSAVERVIEAQGVIDDHSFFPDGNWPMAVDRA